MVMTHILPRYLRHHFINILTFCLLSVILLFLVFDLVENLDKFMDRKVSWNVVLMYYIYYIPYILVLIMPVATLLAAVFSVGSLAKHNEMVAMKALGFSLYQVMITILFLGFLVSLLTFALAEAVVPPANQKREEISRQPIRYLSPVV